MLGRGSEDEMWSRFVFELAIWPQEVTLARWTQPPGPLCLWQCLFNWWDGRGLRHRCWAIFCFPYLQSSLEPLHALTFCLAKLTISSGYCLLRNAFSAMSRKDLMLWKISIQNNEILEVFKERQTNPNIGKQNLMILAHIDFSWVIVAFLMLDFKDLG